MAVLIDTNVVLDILEKRTPLYEASSEVMAYCAAGREKGYIALHSISNIFYILRKQYSNEERRKLLLGILSFLRVTGVKHGAVRRALLREEFLDFEDCLQDECAKEVGADYIVTRNVQDFQNADVKAVTPEEFLKIVKK